MKIVRYIALIWLSSLSLLLAHLAWGTVAAASYPGTVAGWSTDEAMGAIAAPSAQQLSGVAPAATPPEAEWQAASKIADRSLKITAAPTLSEQAAQVTRWPLLDSLQSQSVVVLGLLASLLAGLATGVGAIPVLFTTKVSDQLQGILLGFAAGVMLAATSFSLLIPSIERVTSAGGSGLEAAAVAVGGMLLGSGFIWVTDRTLPYQRLIGDPDGGRNFYKLKGIWLFIIAIAIHNFPEGLAVGVGFGGDNIGNGLALAIGIGLQNMPEGLAVALALVTQRYSKWTAFGVALATGLVEPIGGVFGVGIISLGAALLPWGLAFAAGAMLFVIGDEVIPEAQSLGASKLATAAIVGGFVIMMFLDVTLG